VIFSDWASESAASGALNSVRLSGAPPLRRTYSTGRAVLVLATDTIRPSRAIPP